MRKQQPQKNFIERGIDSYNEYQMRRQRQSCLFIIYAAIAFAILAAILAVIGLVITTVEESQVISDYGEQIANLCSPVSPGTDDPDNAPQGETPLPMLIMRAGTRQRHSWYQDLPQAWRGTSQADTAAVACVEEEETPLETCSYMRNSDEDAYTANFERVQHTTTIHLLNAATGRRIDTLILEGTLPESCPEDDPGGVSTTIEGTEPTFDEAAPWFEAYVFGDSVE